MDHKATLTQLVKDCSTWQDLKAKLSNYNTTQTQTDRKTSSAGKLFEIFCKYYFLTDPKVNDDYKNVWLFDEVPQNIKEKLNIANRTEYGVDLILEDTEGKFIAVQCKFRNNEDSRLSWSKDKIANLFGFSRNADHYAVFTNASELDDVSKGRTDQFTLYTVGDLLEINEETFRAIEKKLTGMPVSIQKATPRDFQTTAINDVLQHFSTHDRAQLILPCGAGKTLTALWIKEQMEAQTTLVLVPSLALLRQTKDEWTYHKNVPYSYICVCSEADIDRNADLPIVHTYELGARVTTDPETIRKFLAHPGKKIIFSTYHSLPSIAEAMRDSSLQFDFILCDEAHKTAGSRHGNSFTLVHSNSKVPGKKRLYMTATPKILSANLKAKLDDDESYLADMSDPEIFGEEAYRMSFKDAIDKGILVDYKIIAIGVTDEKMQNYLQQRRYISTKETIDDLANNYALDLVMRQYNAGHVLTFHSRVQYAKTFAERHKQLATDTLAEYVSGKQTTSQRNIIMAAFEDAPKAVMSNARCLTEGVNVPIIDLIYFCDPKYSKIDIVQAAGRALRKDKHGQKTKGYIVVPIYHTKGDSVETAIDRGSFKNLIQVIRSMCDQDERLQEEINNIAFEKGQRHLSHVDIVVGQQKEPTVTLVGFEERLKAALFNQIIKKSALSWNVQFNNLCLFRKEHSDHWPSTFEIYPDGNKLGQWCSEQRSNFKSGSLAADRISKLTDIGFEWDQAEIAWQKYYENLKRYRRLHPDCWPRKHEEFPRGNKLGDWFRTQRHAFRKHKLDPQKAAKLNLLGVNWKPFDKLWHKQYEMLKNFRHRNPNRWPTPNEEYPRGNKLGDWCGTQRKKYKNSTIEQDRIAKLDKISFIWSPFDEVWLNKYNKLCEFRKQHPNRWPTTRTEYPEGVNIGDWSERQQKRYNKGLLSENQIKMLEEINFPFTIVSVKPSKAT